MVLIDAGGKQVEVAAEVVYHPPSYEFVSHRGVALALVLTAKERLDIRIRPEVVPDEVLALAGDQRLVTVRWGPHQVKLGPASIEVRDGQVVAVQQR